MVYVDTSVIVKLYVKEEHSRVVADWLRQNNEAVPLTPFHELEFANALRLKQFRDELTAEDAEHVREKFQEHEQRGVFHRPAINWPETFNQALNLSNTHTPVLGSRSLDVMHVALALSMGAGRFLTFDERQARLAVAAGLRVETCTSG